MKTLLKKRYGQHFLIDTGVIDRIERLIRPGPEDLMIEAGAGTGALSVRLAPKVSKLLAIEIDRDLLPCLAQALAPYANAEVIGQDILTADLPQILSAFLRPEVRLRIVGNLPYNIATAIITKLVSQTLPIEDMIFMLQLEVARRVAAAPGSKDYGFFSVYCQHYCTIDLGFRVSPSCFVPRPKVYSAMIIMRPRSHSGDPDFEKAFVTVTKAAFAYRRKKLANSLTRHACLAPLVEDMLAQSRVDGTCRAENLSVADYEQLARIYRLKQSDRSAN